MIANENYLPFICDVYNYFLVGHSHHDEDWHFRDCRIINCGNDYNKPKSKIINLENDTVTTLCW